MQRGCSSAVKCLSSVRALNSIASVEKEKQEHENLSYAFVTRMVKWIINEVEKVVAYIDRHQSINQSGSGKEASCWHRRTWGNCKSISVGEKKPGTCFTCRLRLVTESHYTCCSVMLEIHLTTSGMMCVNLDLKSRTSFPFKSSNSTDSWTDLIKEAQKCLCSNVPADSF